jgi:branched-subunit amino acid transport protein
LNDGVWGYVVLLLIAAVAHEPWRWLGLALGRHIDVGSGLFSWVRAVSTSLVAALVVRLVVFPAGVLEGVPLLIRTMAFLAAVACFIGAGYRLALSIFLGAGLLIAGKLLSG